MAGHAPALSRLSGPQPVYCPADQLWLAESAQRDEHLRGREHKRHAHHGVLPWPGRVAQSRWARELARDTLWTAYVRCAARA
eukprot:7526518-Lingulodinium_polyedra.AAC.1